MNKKLGILGPSGTFTEMAAMKYMPDCEPFFYITITEIFEAIEKEEIKEGIVPIENILNGHVMETLDCLYKSRIKIKQAIIIPIEQSLVILPETQKIEKIISHPQALAQCSYYIHKNYADVKIEKVESTATAMKLIADNHLIGIAAIGPSLGAKRYGLNVIKARNLQKKQHTIEQA